MCFEVIPANAGESPYPWQSSLQECLHFRERFIQFARVLAATARIIRFAAAFATNDGGDLLDDLTGLDFGCEIG